MADKSQAGAGVDEIEKCRQKWTKENLDRRMQFLVQKHDCDADVIASLKGDELVNWCLVAEGLVAGVLPKKEVKPIDAVSVMMLMVEQMRKDSDRRDRAEELRREEKEQKEIARKLEQEQKEIARKLEQEKRDKENEKKEENRKVEQERRDRDQERKEQFERERTDLLFREQGQHFAKLQEDG
jgi:hypothetical protein